MNARDVICGALVSSACLTTSQAQQAGPDWTHVQAVASGTTIRVSSQHRRHVVCEVVAVNADSLICTRSETVFFVPVNRRMVLSRSEVTKIKLSRQLLSTVAGGGIGVAAGAAIGAGVDMGAKNQVEEGHLLTFVLALLGGSLGAGIGHGSDFLAGPTIYTAP